MGKHLVQPPGRGAELTSTSLLGQARVRSVTFT